MARKGRLSNRSKPSEIGLDETGFNLFLCVFPQDSLKNLAAGVPGNRANKLHSSGQRFVAGQSLQHVFLNIRLSQARCIGSWSTYDISSGKLSVCAQDRDPNHGTIDDLRMREKHGFQLWWCHLEAAYFDEFLLSVDDVPFPGGLVTVGDIACLEPPAGVEGLRIGLWVLEVARGDSGSSNAELSAHAIG